MYHLIKFRKGWQSEHLARYIVSKFAFIAEPSTIADDIGSDFFCTNFDINDKGFLLPLSSFAIQIKSNKRRFEITHKLSYLLNLELPFFVGVVTKNKQKLTIYSGESIPHFFSLHGNPSTLPNNPKTYINLVDTRDNKNLIPKIDANTYILNFPKVIDLQFSFEYNKRILSDFFSLISVIQKNISAKRSGEYLFDYINNNGVAIYAGCGSAKTYRENFLKRLAEAFINIYWIANAKKEYRVDEFKIYEEIYCKFYKLNGSLPDYLTFVYERCKNELNQSK